MVKIQRRDVIRLSAESGCDTSAVLRLFEGKPVREATRKLVTQAAERLGIDLPKSPEEPRAA